MSAPEGYSPLPTGIRCRCLHLWQEADGSLWCCAAGTEKQRKALNHDGPHFCPPTELWPAPEAK